jgi:hypothetical protein
MGADADGWLEPEDLLRDGARHQWPDGKESTLEVDEVCRLAAPTGQIAAIDPSWLFFPEDGDCVLAEVPPGDYPVILSIVHFPPTQRFPHGLRSLTAATVQVTDRPAVRWEWDQDADGRRLGIGVDTGTGCYYDVANRPVLEALQEHGDRVDQALHAVHTSRSRFLAVEDERAAQLVLFECGMGDGHYPVRIGRDARSTVVAVMLDLELLSHSTGPIG